MRSGRGYYSELKDQSTCVYRCYDAEGELLYVGLTVNPLGRLSKHHSKPWWPEVDLVTLRWFAGREDAKRAEIRAIHHETPLYNITRPRLECC